MMREHKFVVNDAVVEDFSCGKVAAKLWPSQVVSSLRQNFGNFEPVQS